MSSPAPARKVKQWHVIRDQNSINRPQTTLETEGNANTLKVSLL